MNANNEKLKNVIMYTDGACSGNPGPGGYGIILIYGKHKKEISGGFRLTTNNRMELLAATIGLETLNTKCHVTLYSDSKLLVEGLSKNWAIKWRSKGWKRKGNKHVQNPDLWERLLTAYEKHEVEIKWIKGHAGNWGNERSDKLALQAASQRELQIDEAFEQGTTKIKPVTLFDQIGEPSNGSNEENLKSVQQMQQPHKPLVQDKGTVSKPGKRVKITREGQPCRKCSTPVIKKIPRRKKRKPNQKYYYEYYFYCPKCRTMYMVDKVKRYFEDDNP